MASSWICSATSIWTSFEAEFDGNEKKEPFVFYKSKDEDSADYSAVLWANRSSYWEAPSRKWLFGKTSDEGCPHRSFRFKRGLHGQVVNVLYYLSVLLICVHFSDDDGEALDRFFNDLREVLKWHAEAIHQPKKK